jgi:nitronate monooxygenase
VVDVSGGADDDVFQRVPNLHERNSVMLRSPKGMVKLRPAGADARLFPATSCARWTSQRRAPTGDVNRRRKNVAIATAFTERLQLEHPIIQAPMAGGADTPELVAAVCNAGALGSIGAAYLTPEQIVGTAQAVRAKTARPFGMNLFAPLPLPERPLDPSPMLKRLAPLFAELGVPLPSSLPTPALTFPQQLEAALQSGAAMLSFTFGLLPAKAVAAVRKKGIVLIGTATTVDEAAALEKGGVDAIVAQGSEAGGHRGTFATDFGAGMIGTIALVPQIVDAVRVPVIASGGIMDGRGIAAALALGASAVQLGTAFLTCSESGVPEAYREAILHAREDQTEITRAFSGRPARGIINRFLSEFALGEASDSILPFPVQNMLTRPLRTAAAKQGRAEFLNLWAGQGVRLARRQSTAELIARLARETELAIEGSRDKRTAAASPR